MLFRGVQLLILRLCCVLAVTSTTHEMLLEAAVPDALQASSSRAPSITIQDPYDRKQIKDAQRGSLAGALDPGYGPASASRTDLQRAHEAAAEKRQKIMSKAALENKPIPVHDPLEPMTKTEADHLERHMFRRIDAMAGMDNAVEIENARSTENLAAIMTKSEKIKDKLKQAVSEVQEQYAKEEEKLSKKLDGQQNAPVSKVGPNKRSVISNAVKAEEDKLKAADDAKLRQSGEPKEPIAVHKSGNWVDKTRYPDLTKYVPKGDHRDNKSWRERGDTPAAQKKP